MNTVSGSSPHTSLLQRFPALRRLGELPGRRIPVIHQVTATDCGVACLAMSLAFHGHEAPVDEIRHAMGTTRGGVGARDLVETAVFYGLRARPVRLEPEDLVDLARGSILHWKFVHYVVFDRVERRGVRIVDPAVGRLLIPHEEVGKALTGVAIELTKRDDFRQRKGQSLISRNLLSAVSRSPDWPRIAITSLVLEGLALLVPLISARFIDQVIPRDDHALLVVLCAAMVFILGLRLLTTMTRAHLLIRLQTAFEVRMTFGFIEHLLRLPFGFFESRRVGDLQLRLQSVGIIRSTLTGAVLSTSINGIMATGNLVLLLLLSMKMGAVTLGIVLVQGAFYLATRAPLLELAATSVTKQAEAANELNELLTGIESLKAAGTEQSAAQGWAQQHVDVMNIGLRQARLSAGIGAFGETLSALGPTVLLAIGVMEVMAGRMSLGLVIAANALATGFLSPAMGLLSTLQDLLMIRIHLSRLEDVLQCEPEQDGVNMPASRLRGAIRVDRLSFSYGPRMPLAVRDVSYTVDPGQLIAIVGRSGSGKTTLARLLVGLYRPLEGSVEIDGVPLDRFDLRSLRRQVGVVMQRDHIFGTSIRANIALGSSRASLEQIRAAARLACIDEDIMAMNLQYDTPLAAGGSSLSGGQRQRLALARALVSEPSVLLLDEATSALDAATEAAVHRNLRGLQCTRIIVAHRLSTVVDAHRILVMEGGALVEQGTHTELLARNGAYAALVEAQLVG